MKKLLSLVLVFVLGFSLVAPSFARAEESHVSKDSIGEVIIIMPGQEPAENVIVTDKDWADKLEYNNEISEEEAPELFENLEDVSADDIDDTYDNEIDWDSVPLVKDPNQEEPVFHASARVVLIGKLVWSGGKQVIKYGKKIFKKSPKSKVTNALKNYRSGKYTVKGRSYTVDKKDMEHILTRHHPKYWDGSTKKTQTFLDPDLSVNEVKNIVLAVAKKHSFTLGKKSMNTTYQVEAKVDGVTYVLGISKGHMKQLYPKY
ncbi:hypothetical protein [Terribacillus saccharophilus]|uniref:Bacterial EndoU nuclease domain-containing protein n=1 Tax=Terribacillus saccharophilus TaxID=361277 RepID=A0A268ABY9_9BACI|nr:hypothetical protein [Terribacillus saccharophilus]PAD21641.1 hypothetical protein CHH64_07385 [Terribacillus saccharophilus]